MIIIFSKRRDKQFDFINCRVDTQWSCRYKISATYLRFQPREYNFVNWMYFRVVQADQVAKFYYPILVVKWPSKSSLNI